MFDTIQLKELENKDTEKIYEIVYNHLLINIFTDEEFDQI